MALTCCILGCSNGSYRLKKWWSQDCKIHDVPRRSVECVCEPPFSLTPLPTRKKKSAERDKWKRLISRISKENKENLFSPAKDARVCSVHFVDKEPTFNNPFPTQALGYKGYEGKVKRVLTYLPLPEQGPSMRKRARRYLGPELDAADNTTELDAADNTTELDAADNTTELDAADNTTELDAADNTTELDAADNTTELDAADNTTELDAADNTTELDAADNTTELDAADNTTELNAADNTTELDAADNTTELDAADNTTALYGTVNTALGGTAADVHVATQAESLLDSQTYLCSILLSFFTLLFIIANNCRDMYRRYAQSLIKIVEMTKEIRSLKQKVRKLEAEVFLLKQIVSTKKAEEKKAHVYKKLINQKNISYYTGIESTQLFRKLHAYVAPFVRRRWQGSASSTPHTRRNFSGEPSRFGPKRFLDSIDEMLLVFMRLRLGLDLRDLSYRFMISSVLAGKIFTSWIAALAATLGKGLVYTPDQETVNATKPARYRDMPNLMGIIDCTEIFIETPKDFKFQTATWSDYKHHNTLKILISVLPNSMISFVSRVYEGRMSDKQVTAESNFLETIPPFTDIMADKGFNIADECRAHFVTLVVPPGKRGMTQMPSAAVKKTKKIANRRILVEQVIRRLKTFRLLSNELSISSLHNIDSVVLVCAALCNLKKSMYST